MTRLNNYITEKTKQQVGNANKVIKTGYKELFRTLEKVGWDLDQEQLEAAFTLAFFPKFQMRFKTSGEGEEETAAEAGFKFFSSGQTMMNGEIYVYVARTAPKILDSYGKRDDREKAFLRSEWLGELKSILAHELLHREQWKKAGDKWIPKRLKGEISVERYLANPQEIEARAQDAARELIHMGESQEVDMYRSFFGATSKVFKKFMKKVFLFQKELEVEGEF